MNKINYVGHIPEKIKLKAQTIIKNELSLHRGWKKLTCSNHLFSFRLDSKYRILRSESGELFIGDHDFYERKIKSVK